MAIVKKGSLIVGCVFLGGMERKPVLQDHEEGRKQTQTVRISCSSKCLACNVATVCGEWGSLSLHTHTQKWVSWVLNGLRNIKPCHNIESWHCTTDPDCSRLDYTPTFFFPCVDFGGLAHSSSVDSTSRKNNPKKGSAMLCYVIPVYEKKKIHGFALIALTASPLAVKTPLGRFQVCHDLRKKA